MSILPKDAQERKRIPIYSGFVAYFPRTIVALAKLSQEGNDQHHPGTPLHWDRDKSGDELDAAMRHMMEHEWVAHAWRACANCEKHLEKLAAEEVIPIQEPEMTEDQIIPASKAALMEKAGVEIADIKDAE